jgi:hypothetical protein
VLAETDLSGNLIREFIYFNGERVARREVMERCTISSPTTWALRV